MGMNSTFKVDIGDTSGDGHNVSEWVYFKTNFSVKQLDKLHKQIKSVFGVNFNNICSDYEDCLAPNSLVLKMKELGCYNIDLFSWIDGGEYDLGHELDPTTFVVLQLALMKHIDPTLEYSMIQDQTQEWRAGSGGYGLLGN